MITSVLVPLDGSPLAEKAIPWALDLCQRYQAALILVRVGQRPDLYTPQDIPGLDVFFEHEKEVCLSYLQQLQTRLSEGGQVVVYTDYNLGSPAQAILEKVDERKASLVVMTSHGRDGVKRWLLGSVAEKVARHAPCPVMLVRSDQDLT